MESVTPFLLTPHLLSIAGLMPFRLRLCMSLQCESHLVSHCGDWIGKSRFFTLLLPKACMAAGRDWA